MDLLHFLTFGSSLAGCAYNTLQNSVIVLCSALVQGEMCPNNKLSPCCTAWHCGIVLNSKPTSKEVLSQSTVTLGMLH